MTEKLSYELLETRDGFELRRYPRHVVAEVNIRGDFMSAGNAAFGPLVSFISGRNEKSQKIAMTAPVTVEPQPSAMATAAPMTVEPQSADGGLASANRWRIHFVMPRAYTLASIPKPKNDAVQLREIPAKVFVVHTYSWLNTQHRVQQKIQETLQWAQRNSLQVIGAPQLARYDPPWTLPMFRRNEIMVEIAAP